MIKLFLKGTSQILVFIMMMLNVVMGSTPSEQNDTNNHPILYRLFMLLASLVVIVGGWYILLHYFLIRFKIVRELLGMEKKQIPKVIIKKTPRVPSISNDEE